MFWHVIVTLLLGWMAVIAIWLGGQDFFAPVSLPAQIVGACFGIAGLIALAGSLMVAARALPVTRAFAKGNFQTALIAGGAVAGLYVGVTLVLHAYRYEPAIAWAYGGLAAGCLLLALQALPATWRRISRSLKGIGISLAVIGTLVNFWFQSFYLPENTQVGIQYGFSVGPVVTSGGSRIVTVDFTMENQSSVTALTIGSMIVVSEVVIPANESAVPDPTAQNNLSNYAQSQVELQPEITSANPNIRSSGTQTSMVLAVLQPMADASYVFPDDIYSREFDVVVPKTTQGSIVALEIQMTVLYARTTRLVLGTTYLPRIRNFPTCADDEQSSWSVAESAIVRYSRGPQVVYSNWCAELADPYVNWTVLGTDGTHDSSQAQQAIKAGIAVQQSTRNEIIPLP